MIHVIAFLEAVPGRRDDLLAKFKTVIPAVLAEPGCIDYGPALDEPTLFDFQLPVNENAFVVVEKWEDLPSLQKHLETPHMQEFVQNAGDVLKGITAHILQPA